MLPDDLDGCQERFRIVGELEPFFMGKANKFHEASPLGQFKETVHLAPTANQEIFVEVDDHKAALRRITFRLATFAWATAASCWSPRKTRILEIFCCARGMRIFSKRLTRIDTSLSSFSRARLF